MTTNKEKRKKSDNGKLKIRKKKEIIKWKYKISKGEWIKFIWKQWVERIENVKRKGKSKKEKGKWKWEYWKPKYKNEKRKKERKNENWKK